MGTAASSYGPGGRLKAASGPRRRALPLSLRLIVTYALLVAATLMVSGALVIHLTRDHLTSEFDRSILTRVRSFQSTAAQDVSDEDDLARAARGWLSVQGLPSDEIAAVRTRSGQVLTSTGPIELYDIDSWEQVVSVTRARWFDVETQHGPIRMLSVPLTLDDTQMGTVSVGASLDRVTGTLSTLGSGITVAGVLSLAFAALVGLSAIRRAMLPLGRMSKNVGEIEATGDLSKRVALEGPGDEVGRLAETFNDMLERLESAFKTQQRFISDASHEVRTPLTVVRGQLELLGAEIRSVQGHRSHSIALEELDRVSRMVENLLLLARLDEGMALHREPIEVELVLREALLRAMLIEPREHTEDIESGLYVSGAPDPLLQAFTNILTNSVHHAGLGAKLHLETRRNGDKVTIKISDDGIGIAAPDIDRIFERFYRSSAARSGKPTGSGLGLAITASIIHSLGGEISVRSRLGHGTTFEIVLDAADVNVQSLPTRITPVASSHSAVPPLPG